MEMKQFQVVGLAQVVVSLSEARKTSVRSLDTGRPENIMANQPSTQKFESPLGQVWAGSSLSK